MAPHRTAPPSEALALDPYPFADGAPVAGAEAAGGVGGVVVVVDVEVVCCAKAPTAIVIVAPAEAL